MMLSCFNLSSNVRATCVSFLMITVQTALATRESILTVEAGNIEHYHSLEAPFIHDWFGEGVPLWDIGGDTVVTSQYVRLTPTQESRFGWAWNTIPMQVENWEARVTLRIHSQRHYGADGMALWLVEKPYKAEMAGPLMGMEAGFKGIGIIIDTFENGGDKDTPLVRLIHNPTGAANNWNTNTDLHDGLIGCTGVTNMRQHTTRVQTIELIVRYYGNTITMRLISDEVTSETTCFKSYTFPDPPEGGAIPIDYYFGLTAHTGGAFDNHDILSLTVRPLGSIDDPDYPAAARERQRKANNALAFDTQEEEFKKQYYTTTTYQKLSQDHFDSNGQ